MNTINYENDSNLMIATNYYHEMLQKNFDTMQTYLHPDVVLISPLAEIAGRDAVVAAAKNLSQILNDIKIRSKFASGNQIMLAYDFIFLEPLGKLRAAVLMDFSDNLISRIELFYDGRPFETKKNEVFSKQQD